jgi:membrane-associated protease RseP (regulator of RpoE activity)
VSYQGSNLWYIDDAFWEYLFQDTTPLWNCDSGRVSDEGDYWEWSDIASGDLADELGFENGDQIVQIDGITIETADDAFRVFEENASATTHTVVLIRSGTPFTFSYQIN